MAMQECEFTIKVTPRDDLEKKATLAFFKDFKASGGFGQLDRIHVLSPEVMYQGFPGGGRYMLEPCPDAVALVEKFKAHFPGISYSAELRIDFTGGDSLPPDIYRWVSEDVERREQAAAARRRSDSDHERNRIASQLMPQIVLCDDDARSGGGAL